MKLTENVPVKSHTYPTCGIYPHNAQKTYPLIRKTGDAYEFILLCYYTDRNDCKITNFNKYIRYNTNTASFVSCNLTAKEKGKLLFPIQLEVCDDPPTLDWNGFYNNNQDLYRYSDMVLEGLIDQSLSPVIAKKYLDTLKNAEDPAILNMYSIVFAEAYDEIISCANMWYS